MLMVFPPISRLGGGATRRPGRIRLVPVTERLRPAIAAIVRDEPVRAVHVAARLGRVTPARGPAVFAVVAPDDRPLGAISAVRGFAWVLVPEVREDPDVHFALATFIATRGAENDVVVGQEDEVAGVLEGLELQGVTAREVRAQQMMASTGATEPPVPRAALEMRLARPTDLTWLLDAHAGMCREDLGVDQVARNRSGYAAYFRDLIAGGRVHVGEADAGPVFKAEVALRSPDAWLVEGVYTVPEARGLGFARHGMAHIAARARRDGRLTCLYVHRENERAIAVYRSVGFEHVCRWTTAIIGRERPAAGWFGRRR
ncbi:MAG: GNAT family N-acetyltransferase [Acidobacteria bacterium]|nr:MAG: GNAT family N-acetyltransferase [Acidobacteriota bacterium]